MEREIKDLNYYLFKQLDRISDDNLKGEDLDREVTRAKSLTDTATQIIKQRQTQLRAAELFVRSGKDLPQGETMILLLGGGSKNE